MEMTRRAVRALLPLAAGLMGPAMPGTAAVERAPAAEQGSRQPDWMLLAVAGVTLLFGRIVVPRIYRRGRKTPR